VLRGAGERDAAAGTDVRIVDEVVLQRIVEDHDVGVPARARYAQRKTYGFPQHWPHPVSPASNATLRLFGARRQMIYGTRPFAQRFCQISPSCPTVYSWPPLNAA